MDTALHFPTTPKAVKAAPLDLKKQMSVEQAFKAIATSCLEQIHANEEGVARFHDVESLHQMRVGLRRLRAALGMFKDFLRLPLNLEEELNWLVEQLGPARDWDVLVESTLPRVAREGNGMAEVEQAARSRCHALRLHASEAVASTRYQHLMHALQFWADKRGWRDMLPSRARARLTGDIADFADAILDVDQKRLHRRGRKLDSATPEQRHRVRIAAKKTRYATEFFAALYPGKRVRPYVKALSTLQDKLGWLNDVAVADSLLAQLADEDERLRAAAGLAHERLACCEKEGARQARKVWKKFAPMKAPH